MSDAHDLISRRSWNAALDEAIRQLTERADLWPQARGPVAWGHHRPTEHERALVNRVCEGECRAVIGHLKALRIPEEHPPA